MTPLRNIRKNVLGLRQHELAKALGVEQSTISRWEQSGGAPVGYQQVIRDLAKAADPEFSDSLFFEIPDQVEGDAAA